MIVFGCGMIMIWGILYLIFSIFRPIFNYTDNSAKMMAAVIVDCILFAMGISLGGWGIIVAILCIICLHYCINNGGCNQHQEEQRWQSNYDERYGIISYDENGEVNCWQYNNK